jgi:hypothetical protein
MGSFTTIILVIKLLQVRGVELHEAAEVSSMSLSKERPCVLARASAPKSHGLRNELVKKDC